jgi:hypothetical protein
VNACWFAVLCWDEILASINTILDTVFSVLSI